MQTVFVDNKDDDLNILLAITQSARNTYAKNWQRCWQNPLQRKRAQSPENN
jgi:hypothetical protein